MHSLIRTTNDSKREISFYPISMFDCRMFQALYLERLPSSRSPRWKRNIAASSLAVTVVPGARATVDELVSGSAGRAFFPFVFGPPRYLQENDKESPCETSGCTAL